MNENVLTLNTRTTADSLPITNATSGTITNCLVGAYPYQGYSYTYPSYDYTNYAIKVEAVENGFVVHKDGKKFIVSKAEEIVKYLKNDKSK